MLLGHEASLVWSHLFQTTLWMPSKTVEIQKETGRPNLTFSTWAKGLLKAVLNHHWKWWIPISWYLLSCEISINHTSRGWGCWQKNCICSLSLCQSSVSIVLMIHVIILPTSIETLTLSSTVKLTQESWRKATGSYWHSCQSFPKNVTLRTKQAKPPPKGKRQSSSNNFQV